MGSPGLTYEMFNQESIQPQNTGVSVYVATDGVQIRVESETETPGGEPAAVKLVCLRALC